MNCLSFTLIVATEETLSEAIAAAESVAVSYSVVVASPFLQEKIPDKIIATSDS
ncbi:hypothetical protein [Chryseobacterium piperi]|uniref:hypothetical protein n=1 Tax=Chryseobacterium piperi TaxID=558152 RepID=UPI000A50DDE7|nr:hypothetical protein [Chryseobacterium piperi]